LRQDINGNVYEGPVSHASSNDMGASRCDRPSMSPCGPSRRFAAGQQSFWNLRRSGLTSDIADPTAVVQTPCPPADLNARGVQRRAAASRMQDRSRARA
jgi:hypothetical protein